MPDPLIKISEKHIIGRNSHEWLASAGELPALAAKGIEWLGLSDLARPYEIVRHAPSFGHVLGCVGGEGEVWADGEWRRMRPGMIFVNPPHYAEALRAVAGRRWRICWVHTKAGFFAPGSGAATEPFLEAGDARPLRHALEGLKLCVEGDAASSLTETWCEIVFAHARTLAARAGGAARLGRLWEQVSDAPAEDWDIDRLGELAAMSREHLRRLSLKETGRTPMEQVTYLRMRRAAGLLRFTRQTLDLVAEAVGYRNEFVFSNAFKRVMGVRPGAYRAGRGRDGDRRAEFVLRPAGDRGPFAKAAAAPPDRWHQLDLRRFANQSTTGSGRGWFGAVMLAADFPSRPVSLLGVPMAFIQPAENERRNLLLLRSRRLEELGLRRLATRVNVPVDEHCEAIYVLHAAGWTGAGGHLLATYSLKYDDGGIVPLTVHAPGDPRTGGGARRGAEVQDWWPGFDPLNNNQARTFTLHLGGTEAEVHGMVHLLEWLNPRPDHRVLELMLEARDGAEGAVGVLAISILRRAKAAR
jgi:AraC-like DNA-binding protein